MPIRAKIALSEPSTVPTGRYFSFKLKQQLSIEPAEYQKTHKLLVISNIQGDFHVFRELLLNNGIIDKMYHWTFGDGHLVIAGDCLGESTIGLECLWLVYALEEKARSKGGYVHFILGKNELKHLNGPWRYLQPRYANSRKTSKPPYVVLYDGNSELRRWLQTKNVIEKIGSVLVSYTDMSIETPHPGLPLLLVNKLARQYYYRVNELHSKNIISSVLSSHNLFNTPHSYFQQEVVKTKEDYIDQKLTIRKITDFTYIFNNDTPGNYNRKISALLIKDNQLYPIDAAEESEKIYSTF